VRKVVRKGEDGGVMRRKEGEWRIEKRARE